MTNVSVKSESKFVLSLIQSSDSVLNISDSGVLMPKVTCSIYSILVSS